MWNLKFQDMVQLGNLKLHRKHDSIIKIWNLCLDMGDNWGDVGVNFSRFFRKSSKFSKSIFGHPKLSLGCPRVFRTSQTMILSWPRTSNWMKISKSQNYHRKWKDMKVSVPEATRFHFPIGVHMVRSTLLFVLNSWNFMNFISMGEYRNSDQPRMCYFHK